MAYNAPVLQFWQERDAERDAIIRDYTLRYNTNVAQIREELQEPFLDFFFRERANVAVAQNDSVRFRDELRRSEEHRLIGFTQERHRAIVRQREKQLQRIDYIKDVLDVLLKHCDDPENFQGRKRHGMTLIIEQDYRLYLQVARQELHIQ